MNDIKRVCPSVQTIVHSKWLMMYGSMEEIQEGEGRHPCYRVYRHDMPLQRVQMYGFNLSGTKVQTCVGIIVCCTCFLTKMESV